MSGLLIKDVPDDLHRALKRRARLHRRSMANEALVILESALSDRAGAPAAEEAVPPPVRGRRPLSDEVLEEALKTGRP